MNLQHFKLEAVMFALAAGSLTACGGPDPDPEPEPEKTKRMTVEASFDNDGIDVLFMVDNSSTMREKQLLLRAGFPSFVGALKPRNRSLPDLHIGVVTSDVGTNGGTALGGCRSNGDNGVLQTHGLTLTGGLNYLTDVSDPTNPSQRLINYPGTLASAFSQIADVGTGGCGFEQPLNSVARAIAQPANGNFLRPNALLAIVFITDEDDCSMQPNGKLVTETEMKLGNLDSFRCTRAGVICDGVDDMTAVGPRTGCRSREDSDYLSKVTDLASAVRATKGAQADQRIFVATLAGPQTPFAVGLNAQQLPSLEPSCSTVALEQTAAPAVRIGAFSSLFGKRYEASICASNFEETLASMATEIRDAGTSACLPNALAEPRDCSVIVTPPNGQPQTVPACDATASNAPCWKSSTNASACPAPSSGQQVIVEQGSQPFAVGTKSSFDCLVML